LSGLRRSPQRPDRPHPFHRRPRTRPDRRRSQWGVLRRRAILPRL